MPYLFVELYALDPDPAAAVRVRWALSGDGLLGQGDAIGPAIVGPDGAVYQATVEGIFAFDPDGAAPARRIFYPPGGTMTSIPSRKSREGRNLGLRRRSR